MKTQPPPTSSRIQITENELLARLIKLSRTKISENEIFEHISEGTFFQLIDVPEDTFDAAPPKSPFINEHDLIPIDIDEIVNSISDQHYKIEDSAQVVRSKSRSNNLRTRFTRARQSSNVSAFERIGGFAKRASSHYFA